MISKIRNRDPNTGRIKRGHTVLSNEQLEEWFLERVLIAPFSTCWEWLGGKRSGYGRFRLNQRKQISAHRFSWEMHVGPIPPGLVLDHVCRNRGCVNPAHLRIVTAAANTLMPGSRATGALNKDKTHCKHGHEFNGQNTGWNKYGNRWCKSCNRERYARNQN